MSKKLKLHNLDQFNQAVELLTAIQNAGIATSFISLNGHVNNADIRLYFPEWHRDTPCHFDDIVHMEEPENCEDDFARTQNEKVLNRLSKVLATGKCIDGAGNVVDIDAENLKARRELFESLKSEFEPAI